MFNWRSTRKPVHDVADAVRHGWLAPGLRVYAFGDVHGRADLLSALKADIASDLERDPVDRAIVIGLGDYVDRGEASKDVLDLLGQGFAGAETVLLKGNHESFLLTFLDRPEEVGPGWFDNGGWECVRSYGVVCPPHPAASQYRTIRDAFSARLPSAHRQLLQSLRNQFLIDGYCFVHAGVRPGVPLEAQSERDMLWIRTGFADRDERFDLMIVHGHSPVATPFIGRHRINIDTGAYATGHLTCIVLEAERRRLLEATG